jgi:hypothetical protein
LSWDEDVERETRDEPTGDRGEGGKVLKYQGAEGEGGRAPICIGTPEGICNGTREGMPVVVI